MPRNVQTIFVLVMKSSYFVSTYDPKRPLACLSKIRDSLGKISHGDLFLKQPASQETS